MELSAEQARAAKLAEELGVANAVLRERNAILAGAMVSASITLTRAGDDFKEGLRQTFNRLGGTDESFEQYYGDCYKARGGFDERPNINDYLPKTDSPKQEP